MRDFYFSRSTPPRLRYVIDSVGVGFGGIATQLRHIVGFISPNPEPAYPYDQGSSEKLPRSWKPHVRMSKRANLIIDNRALLLETRQHGRNQLSWFNNFLSGFAGQHLGVSEQITMHSAGSSTVNFTGLSSVIAPS